MLLKVKWSMDLLLRKWSFLLSVPLSFSDCFVTSATKSQEVLFCKWLLKCLSLSIHDRVVGLLSELGFSVCVWRLKWFASVKWKGLPGWWKQAVCSCPDLQNGWGHRWDFCLVDFSSDLAPLCLDRHGNVVWNGRASYWMRKDLGLRTSIEETGSESCVCVLGGMWRWGQYNVTCDSKPILATN